MLFIEYPTCSTCRKAKKWLDDRGAAYEDRHIVSDNPRAEELRVWQKKSNQPLKNFFNTSGMRYRQLNLKTKLPQMSEAEQLELLASDGMLVKRPLLILEDTVLVGFREQAWEEALS
ncbi:MAG: arsenate reductase family protein [Ruminococcus sp.]|nr:arsenate reductase family protein [Ruminococcus sp.]